MKTQTPPIKRQTGKKVLPRRSIEEYTTYVVEVIDWELPYSFLINHDSKHFPSPYSEHLHLQVKGVLREPKKLDGKEIDLTFIGERKIIPEINNLSSTNKPSCVGTIILRGENRHFMGSLPFDSLQIVAPMLESKRLRYVQLHGLSPYRSHATTKSIHFFKEYNPDEW